VNNRLKVSIVAKFRNWGIEEFWKWLGMRMSLSKFTIMNPKSQVSNHRVSGVRFQEA
jgi:hypothetical protein